MCLGRWPVGDGLNLPRVHTDIIIGNHKAKEFDRVLVEIFFSNFAKDDLLQDGPKLDGHVVDESLDLKNRSE